MNDDTPTPPDSPEPSAGSYRRRALLHYKQLLPAEATLTCIVCGFGIEAVLEIAHLNQDRKDGKLENLAVMCPTCHKMYDIGLIPEDAVAALQKRSLQPDWGPRMKNAGPKAAATRKVAAAKKRKTEAGKKAWVTRLNKSESGGA